MKTPLALLLSLAFASVATAALKTDIEYGVAAGESLLVVEA